MYIPPKTQQPRVPDQWSIHPFSPPPPNPPSHQHSRQKPHSNEARIGLLAFRTVNSTTPVTLAYACGGQEAGRMPTKCFQVRKKQQCWVWCFELVICAVSARTYSPAPPPAAEKTKYTKKKKPPLPPSLLTRQPTNHQPKQITTAGREAPRPAQLLRGCLRLGVCRARDEHHSGGWRVAMYIYI